MSKWYYYNKRNKGFHSKAKENEICGQSKYIQTFVHEKFSEMYNFF